MFYVYEGRTIRGIGLMGWGLLAQTAAVVVNGASLALVGLFYSLLVQNPDALFGPLAGVSAALCGVILAEAAAGVLFLVGFFQIHSGRHEYGLDEAHSLDGALIFLLVYIVLSAFSVVYSSSTAVFPGAVGPSNVPDLVGALAVAPVAALFAGLTLARSVESVAGPIAKIRIRTGLALGVLGAAVGPALSLLASSGETFTIDQVSAGIVAGAVAGQGIAAISLALFWLGYQETREALESGSPAPVLPRIEQLYPWLYGPWYPYPPASLPPQPPKP